MLNLTKRCINDLNRAIDVFQVGSEVKKDTKTRIRIIQLATLKYKIKLHIANIKNENSNVMKITATI